MGVRDSSFFHDMGETALAKLESISFESIYEDGSVIFFEGESSKYLHILVSGTVELIKTGAKTSEIYLHSLKSGSMIAELPTFEQIPFPATARSVGVTKILKIDFTIFKSILLTDQGASFGFITSLLQKIKILDSFINKELQTSAEEKLLWCIEEEPRLFQELKQVEIAKRLNMTPETLSRTLKKLREEHKIAFRGKVPYILTEDTHD